jgi:hypothetical protein
MAAHRLITKGNLTAISQYNPEPVRFHHEYIPGFLDVCVYEDQDRFGKARNTNYPKEIALAETDYFVQNFKEAVMTFVGLGIKTVIVMGEHTNQGLMSVFLICRQVGLELIVVRDLIDAAWVFELQKNHSRTHSEGNRVVNEYVDEKLGESVLSYDVLAALREVKVRRKAPNYTMFTNVATLFKNI